jgi:hypothetical protein
MELTTRPAWTGTAATIAKLADALDVPLSDLFAAAERGDFHTDLGEQGAGDRR